MQRKSKVRKLHPVVSAQTEKQIREEISAILFLKGIKHVVNSFDDEILDRVERRLHQALFDVSYRNARAKARTGQ